MTIRDELARIEQLLAQEEEVSLVEEQNISRYEELKRESVDLLHKSKNERYRMGRQIEALKTFLNYS